MVKLFYAKSKFTLITLFLFLISGISCIPKNEDERVSVFLNKFYYEYNKTIANCQWPNCINSLDSLHQIYCSKKFTLELSKGLKEYGLDEVPLLPLYSTDLEDLNLVIVKDLKLENAYYVSYIAKGTDLGGKIINDKIKVHLTVIKVNGEFKIDSVIPD